MINRHEHHLRIADDRGGRFLEPHQHLLWIDSTLKDRPCYEQQRGSSKVNLIEAELAVEVLRRLNNALGQRGYGAACQATASGGDPVISVRQWAAGQLASVPAETLADLFERGQVRLNGRPARPQEPVRPGDQLKLNARFPVGVITFYGAQVGEIRARIRHSETVDREAFRALDLRVDTVDRFQGMERAIILVNLVRARPQMQGGQHVKEYRRINVAFSRAQSLLIIIGSVRTFRDIEIELPSVAGGPPRKLPVYRNIYDIVTRYGGRRYARQILD